MTRLDRATVLAFMKQKGEAGFRLIEKVGLAGSQKLGAQSLYLTAKATDHMQVAMSQRPFSKAQSSQPGLCGVLGEGNLAPHTRE